MSGTKWYAFTNYIFEQLIQLIQKDIFMTPAKLGEENSITFGLIKSKSALQ